MDYKQKYKDALERARKYLYDTNKNMSTEFFEATERAFVEIFPELANSEDIRKFLIDFIKVCKWTEKRDQEWPLREDVISWLENQGEQKTTDKEQTNKNLQDNDFRRMFEQKPTDESTTELSKDIKVGDWVETCKLYPGIIQAVDEDFVEVFYPQYAFNEKENPNKTYCGGSQCSITHCGVHKITPEYAIKLMSMKEEDLISLWESSETIDEYNQKVLSL